MGMDATAVVTLGWMTESSVSIDAEPGTLGWLLLRRDQLRSALQDVRLNQSVARGLYDDIRTHGGWQHLQNVRGQPFHSFDEFCADPNGFSIPRDRLEEKLTAQQMAQDPSVQIAKHGGDRKSKDQGNIVTLIERGNSARYLVARLKRDRPDIAERLAAGEFKSAREAAKAAGLKIEYPLSELRRAWRRATSEERATFRAEIANGVECVDQTGA